jgi:hypothetical protein
MCTVLLPTGVNAFAVKINKYMHGGKYWLSCSVVLEHELNGRRHLLLIDDISV